MKVKLTIEVLDDEGYPVHRDSSCIENPEPTGETSLGRYYEFGFRYIEPKNPIYLCKGDKDEIKKM